jgi:hypothetical protein
MTNAGQLGTRRAHQSTNAALPGVAGKGSLQRSWNIL